ncbi:MAG: hypothetical protein K2W94_08185 [Alphaproteobacteria bacterium]|nr:hypothetical protein [Alphaproteobacteria bacterium]
MINFKINPNPRGGWLVIERGKTIESLQIFFNDEEFLTVAGSENTANAIDLFERTARRKNRVAVIFDYHEFVKWDLRHWDNNPEILMKAEELGWVTRI